MYNIAISMSREAGSSRDVRQEAIQSNHLPTTPTFNCKDPSPEQCKSSSNTLYMSLEVTRRHPSHLTEVTPP